MIILFFYLYLLYMQAFCNENIALVKMFAFIILNLNVIHLLLSKKYLLSA